MEADMNRGSYSYKPTAEDRLIISKLKWSLATIYGAILLMLVLFVLASPNRDRSEIAKGSAEQGFSSASAAGKSEPAKRGGV
jgi:hypothetical protein